MSSRIAHRASLMIDRDVLHVGSVALAACVLSAGLVYAGYFVHTFRVARSAPCQPRAGRCLLLFGAEGPGLSQAALDEADDVVYISQFGSVRSINAGAAAAVAMHSWVAQHAVIDGPGAAADSGSSAVIKA